MKCLRALLATHVCLAPLCFAGELTFDEPTPFADAIEAYAKANSDADRTIDLARFVLSQPPVIRDSLASNDFHFTYNRLIRDENKPAGWSGWQWLASALDDKETLCVSNEYGAIQTLTTNGKLFRFSNESACFETRSAQNNWAFSITTLNANPVLTKGAVTTARWAEISKNDARFHIDLGALLRETKVKAISASTEPPVVVYRTDGNVSFEMRLHKPVDLIRFQTPLRSLRMISSDGNGIGRLTLRRGSSVPRRKMIAEQILVERLAPTDDGVTLPLIRFSDDLHYVMRSAKRPAARDVWSTIQRFAVDTEDRPARVDRIIRDETELSHLLYFMASMASEVLGDVRFNDFAVGHEQNVKKTFVRNVGSLAKLAKRTATKAPFEVPCDEPAAEFVFSTYCTPLTLTQIERYACELLEDGDLSEADRFTLVEGVAEWGEPSFYDAECLLPKTMAESLSAGIIKARWGRILSEDEVSALVSASNGMTLARLPAVESLVASGQLRSIPQDALRDWFDARVVNANREDQAIPIYRLTNTELGRSYWRRELKSLDLDLDEDLERLIESILDTRDQAAAVERRLLKAADIGTRNTIWRSLLKRLLK